MGRSPQVAASLLLALSLGCSGGRSGDPPPADGGTDRDAGAVEGVTPAALPVLTPCPDGWRPVELEEGVTVCDPWPEGGPRDCGDGTAHFPGSDGCEPVGPACPTDGDFATDLPTDRDLIYVSGGAGTGGSGTRDDPFHDLGDAFRAASGGEVFALGVGTHTIAGVFPEDTTFWGACTAATHVVPGFDDPVTGTITAVEGARVELHNLHIRGPTPGVRVEASSTVVADDLIIEGTGVAGIWVIQGSTFTGHGIVVRDTVGSDEGFGRAISSENGSTVEIERGAFERTREIAVQMFDEGSVLRLVDVAIRDTQPETDEAWGRAIEVGMGVTAELRRVALESNLEHGVFAGGAGASVTIEDSVVRGTRERRSDGETGRGLHVQEGGTLSASRVWVEDSREIGIYGSTEGGEVRLRDVVVRGTRSRRSDQVGGRGVQVQWGVHLDAERVLLADNEEDGLFVATDPTTARVADVTVVDTRPSPAGGHGRGIEVVFGAHAEIHRTHVAGNTDIGMFVHDGSEATVTDLAVTTTEPNPDEQSYGRGVSVQQGSRLTGDRVRVLDNHEIGIHVSASILELTDVHVERTLEQPCVDTTCPNQGRGVGLSSIEDATATLTDFTIADNTLAGIFLGTGGTVTLIDGEVARHPIGIHTGSEELDFETQVRDVAFVDNDRNVDATVLPLPDPSSPGQVEL